MRDSSFATLTHTSLVAVKRELEDRLRKTNDALGQAAEAGAIGAGHYEVLLRHGGARKAFGDMLSYVNALLREEEGNAHDG